MKNKTPYDNVIGRLFSQRWTENLANAPIEQQRAQLYKTLFDQCRGYWSGHTAYNLAVDGGFLIDGKSNTYKNLTECGKEFMFCCNENWKREVSNNRNLL